MARRAAAPAGAARRPICAGMRPSGCAAAADPQGLHILARRHAGHGGEIDIVARRGRTLVFVEVKARADLEARRCRSPA